jgi:GntR family transcriptional regulator, histidine utilization repressor
LGAPSETIDELVSGAGPLYDQVKKYILDRVTSGTWEEGYRLPSEHQFAQDFGVSRMTVHRALRELSADGTLVRVQGVGTFVGSGKPLSTFFEIRNIAEEIRSRGHTHSASVHLLHAEVADKKIAEDFNLPIGAEVFHSIIVHRENDIPVQLEDRFVNPSFAPGYLNRDLEKMTPNEYLAMFGQPDEVEHVFEAVIPSAKVRRLLAMEDGEPCLLLHRRTWVNKLTATKVALYHPGSRYRLGGRFTPKR